MTIIVMHAWQILLKGGPMMGPIFLLSIAVLAIGINRWIWAVSVYRQLLADKPILMESLRQGQLKDTVRLCESRPGPLADALKAGILKFGSSADLLQGTMEEKFFYEVDRWKTDMRFLSLITNAAPLLGLLGTVIAMTVAFHAVVLRSNVLNPMTAGELAMGIWQALLTTAAGLFVGILALTIHGFLMIRINTIIAFIQRSILEMRNVLLQLSELRGSVGEGLT